MPFSGPLSYPENARMSLPEGTQTIVALLILAALFFLRLTASARGWWSERQQTVSLIACAALFFSLFGMIVRNNENVRHSATAVSPSQTAR